MTFLCQVNFSEVPELETYPTSGLLQWFVDGTDDRFGLTWEAGLTRREGLTVMWCPEDQLRPSRYEPSDEVPCTDAHDGDPFETVKGKAYGPHRVTLQAGQYLPHPNNAYENSDESEAMASYADVTADLDDVAPYPLFAEGFAVGGRPVLVQGDPMARDRDEDDSLPINLDSAQGLFMWGDVGRAQLFGSPSKLASGATDSLY